MKLVVVTWKSLRVLGQKVATMTPGRGHHAHSDGTVYKGATILHHDAATATILYDDGGRGRAHGQAPA